MPAAPIEVAERADVLRQRIPLDRLLLEADRSVEAPAGRGHVGQPVERLDVAGDCPDGRSVLARGCIQPPDGEVELPQLNAGKPRGLAAAAGRIGGQLHRLDGGPDPAEQLERIGSPGVRGDPGLELAEVVEGGERLVVASELDERVADRRIDESGVRRHALGAPGEGEALAKLVAGVCKRRQPDQRLDVVRVFGECPVAVRARPGRTAWDRRCGLLPAR